MAGYTASHHHVKTIANWILNDYSYVCKAFATKDKLDAFFDTWVNNVKELSEEEFKRAVKWCHRHESYLPSFALFLEKAYGFPEPGIAYEAALVKDFSHPAIYYTVKNIKDWDIIAEDRYKRDRFIENYKMLRDKILDGYKLDALEYDIFVTEHYVNPFGDNTGDYTSYNNFNTGVFTNCNESLVDPKGKILVVEDDRISRQVLKYFLHDLQYETCSAVDICGAMELYANVDMVFLDIGLPKVDGLEFCKRVRVGTINKDVPIIGVTALKFEDVEARANAAGITEMYQKPLKQDQVQEILNAHLTNG